MSNVPNDSERSERSERSNGSNDQNGPNGSSDQNGSNDPNVTNDSNDQVQSSAKRYPTHGSVTKIERDTARPKYWGQGVEHAGGEDAVPVHASDVDPEVLQRMLASATEPEQAGVFRKLLLRRLAAIAFVVWVLSWPAHVLPHIALWVALAIVALAVVLTAPPPQSIT